MKLRMSMQMTERKQKEAEDNFNRSVVEASKTLETIERDRQKRVETAKRTIEKVREKCQN